MNSSAVSPGHWSMHQLPDRLIRAEGNPASLLLAIGVSVPNHPAKDTTCVYFVYSYVHEWNVIIFCLLTFTRVLLIHVNMYVFLKRTLVFYFSLSEM